MDDPVVCVHTLSQQAVKLSTVQQQKVFVTAVFLRPGSQNSVWSGDICHDDLKYLYCSNVPVGHRVRGLLTLSFLHKLLLTLFGLLPSYKEYVFLEQGVVASLINDKRFQVVLWL